MSAGIEIPVVRRARGYRVYLADGRRLVDYHLGGGAYLVGHRPEGVVLRMKNSLAKAPAGAYPGFEVRRLAQAISLWIPEVSTAACRVFASEGAARTYLRDTHHVDRIAGAFEIPEEGGAAFWRPFTSVPSAARIILPLFPFGGDWGVHVAVVRDETTGVAAGNRGTAPPFLLAGLAAGIHVLLGMENYSEEHWARFDGPAFERTGPYLFPRWGSEEHGERFFSALRAGFLLPPEHGSPAIVPADLSPGELALFKKWQEDWA